MLDLQDLSLNGIRLGQPADVLSDFGRPSNKRPFRARRFIYGEIGHIAETDAEGQIDFFAVAVDTDPVESIGPTRLDVVRPSGGRASIAQETSLDELHAMLGPPAKTDEDGDEVVVFYDIKGYYLEVECSPAQKVARVNLYAKE